MRTLPAFLAGGVCASGINLALGGSSQAASGVAVVCGVLMLFSNLVKSRAVALTLASLLLVASPAAAQGTLFLSREFQAISVLDPNPILAGNDLVFSMDSGDASAGFTWPIPAMPPSCCTTGEIWTLTEADAATYSINWDALEAILAGPAPKTIHFGPEGFEQTSSFQLLAGYLSSATINEIRLTLGQADTRWYRASINFRGSIIYALAPEPSSFLLLVGCAHLLCVRALWR